MKEALLKYAYIDDQTKNQFSDLYKAKVGDDYIIQPTSKLLKRK